MNNKILSRAAVTGISMLMAVSMFAQGPVGDEIKVTFDRPIQVGSQILPAGDYTVRQVTSASNPRVLEFKTNNDNKLVATVTAIPVILNTPPSETKVVLQDEGGGARLSRILVQGKTFGYGFPGEAMSSSQATTASAQLSGSYAPAATATVASANRVVETPPARPVETPPAAAPAPTPAPVSEAPAAANPAPAPSAAPEIPATALGWADVMALGLAMAAVGFMLFRREARRS
jgi:hypothetical protein